MLRSPYHFISGLSLSIDRCVLFLRDLFNIQDSHSYIIFEFRNYLYTTRFKYIVKVYSPRVSVFIKYTPLKRYTAFYLILIDPAFKFIAFIQSLYLLKVFWFCVVYIYEQYREQTIKITNILLHTKQETRNKRSWRNVFTVYNISRSFEKSAEVHPLLPVQDWSSGSF